MSEDGVLKATGLAVGYVSRRSRRAVLEDVTVSLKPGEMVCVMGRNGAGKSTLLRALAGLDRPLAGRIELFGEALDELAPRRRAQQVGVVLPERIEATLMTARELVALGRYPHTNWTGRLRPRDHTRVAEALEQLGVTELAERSVGTLSDGERQKVTIARAVAQEPRLFVLDEPTAFLDLPGRWDVMSLLRALAHSPGRAVLVSTHDLDVALRFADRLWLVAPGGELVTGEPEELVREGALVRTFGKLAGGFLPDVVKGDRFARL